VLPAVGFPLRPLSPRALRAIVWAAGLGALLAATVAWVIPAQPYQAPWAWISFIGMCIVDDFLLGSREDASWGELPKITLLAAIIMFRRHPEIVVLVALTAAPLSSLFKGQTPVTQVTATAQWVIAAVSGASIFRLVGFEDPPHFIVATVALMAVYYSLGPLAGAWLEASFAGTVFTRSFRRQRRLAISLEILGALLALAWRTSWLEAAALKIADGALVAVAGIFIGFLLGGRSSRLFNGGPPVPARPVAAAGVVLLLSQFVPAPASWLLPLALSVVAGIWAVWRGLFPIALGAIGAYCNEVVRAANAGRMPVEGDGMLATLGGPGDTYVLAGPSTNFGWLDDRFHLPAPFPGIASAGDIVIAIGVAWFIAHLMLRQEAQVVTEAPDAGRDPADADLAAA
jgi:Family of unknown function (DUF5317)